MQGTCNNIELLSQRQLVQDLTYIDTRDFGVDTLISMYRNYRYPGFSTRSRDDNRKLMRFIGCGTVAEGSVLYYNNKKVFSNVVKSFCYSKREFPKVPGGIFALDSNGRVFHKVDNRETVEINIDLKFDDIMLLDTFEPVITLLMISTDGSLYSYKTSGEMSACGINNVSKIVLYPGSCIYPYLIIDGKVYQYFDELSKVFEDIDNVVDFATVSVGSSYNIHYLILTSNGELFFKCKSKTEKINLNVIHLSSTNKCIVFLTDNGNLYKLYSTPKGFYQTRLIEQQVMSFSLLTPTSHEITFILFDGSIKDYEL